jgi:hypothetical protein
MYVNGCSHTDDFPWNERFDVDHKNTFSWSAIVMSGLSDNFKYIRNLSDLEDNEFFKNEHDFLINDAVSGASNDYIFQTSLESITRLININQKPDLVIIQWSGPNRRFHIMPNGVDRKFVNPGENLEYHLKFEPMASTHTLHYIYCLQEILNKNNIKYYFFNYLSLDPIIENLNVFKMVNFKKFIDFGNKSNYLYDGLLKIIKEKKLNMDEQGHADIRGSNFIAEKILEKMTKII